MQNKTALSIEKISKALNLIYQSKTWNQAIKIFKKSKKVYYLGHGGNLAICDHAATDLSRLTDKIGICPGSAVVTTSYINDFGWNNWLEVWIKKEIKTNSKKNVCAIIITSTYKSKDVINAQKFLLKEKIPVIVFTVKKSKNKISKFYVELQLDVNTYHDAEVCSLGLTYDLITASGYKCPKINI